MGLIITSENDIKGQRHGREEGEEREEEEEGEEGGGGGGGGRRRRKAEGRDGRWSLERKRAKCHLTPHVLLRGASDSVSLAD